MASWDHVTNFYKVVKSHPYEGKIAPKLTDSYLINNSFEKVRVCYAAHIFNRTVACGIYTHASFGALLKEATSTFINNMNELLDVFKSSSKSLQK